MKDLKANLLKSAIKLPQNTYQKLHVNAGHLSNKDRYTSYLSDASHLKLDFPSRLRKLECQSIFASPTATLGCNRNFHCRFHRFIEAGITTKKTTSSTKNNDTEKILEVSVNQGTARYFHQLLSNYFCLKISFLYGCFTFQVTCQLISKRYNDNFRITKTMYSMYANNVRQDFSLSLLFLELPASHLSALCAGFSSSPACPTYITFISLSLAFQLISLIDCCLLLCAAFVVQRFLLEPPIQ